MTIAIATTGIPFHTKLVLVIVIAAAAVVLVLAIPFNAAIV
eukprot:CAMPEP_0178721890 /NCGR_PEP_ID=MMETSP0699-20121125/24623_1 /TAXON_ID=265572 /ORGANISM="Extubocellulus spinifer, Strain CCMP396" /LENGTH=40 /DNA_ID= /DNA_START= /DNA_END= /DNA_ORIENTATION=